MEDHLQLLQSLSQKESLSPVEVKDGVVACFINTNREFVRRRMPEVDPHEVDATLEQLMAEVFEEQHLDPQQPNLTILRRAQEVLEAQSGFEAEPELIDMHRNIIDTLFAKARR